MFRISDNLQTNLEGNILYKNLCSNAHKRFISLLNNFISWWNSWDSPDVQGCLLKPVLFRKKKKKCIFTLHQRNATYFPKSPILINNFLLVCWKCLYFQQKKTFNEFTWSTMSEMRVYNSVGVLLVVSSSFEGEFRVVVS